MTTMIDKTEWITTKQAAELMGMSDSSVRRLCIEGKVRGRHFASVWQVDRKSAEKFAATEQLTGRPRGS